MGTAGTALAPDAVRSRPADLSGRTPHPGECAVYVCICFAVGESELAQTIAAGARTEEEVGDACAAGTGCGSCLDRICDRLRVADLLHGTAIAAAA